MPIISVIMLLEKGKKIRPAVESILNQTIIDFEFIILVTTDLYSDILNSYNDRRIKVISRQGANKAEILNQALKISSGRYIARMEEDGFSAPDRLEKQVKYLQDNPQKGLVGSWFKYVNQFGQTIKSFEPEREHSNILRILLHENCFADGSVMFEKECALKVGGYDESLQYFPDYGLSLRISSDKELATVNSYLYFKTTNENYLLYLFSHFLFNLIGEKFNFSRETIKRIILKRVDKLKHLVSLQPDTSSLTAEQKEKDNVRSSFVQEIKDARKRLELLKDSLGTYPLDDSLYFCFEELFEKIKSNLSRELYEEMNLFFYMITCIRYPDDETYFNDTAEIFEKDGNRHLSFLCHLKSLNNNPGQESIYLKAKEHRKQNLGIPLLKKESCLISVIMPTFNRPKIIRESIESVLSQTIQDFELIIINDGGSDEVEETVKQLNSAKIRYYKIKHKGLAGALNEGIAKAQGKYITYLDDDDIYYHDHLERLHNLLKNEKAPFAYSKSLLVKGHYEQRRFVKERELGTYTEPYSKKRLHEGCIISTLNVMHLKKALAATGGFNEYLPWSMDWDLWIRFSEHFEIIFLNEFTGEYRLTDKNMTMKDRYKGRFYLSNILGNYYASNKGLSILMRAAYDNEDYLSFKSYLNELLDNVQILSKKQLENILILLSLQKDFDFYLPASRLFASDYKLFLSTVLSNKRLFSNYVLNFEFLKHLIRTKESNIEVSSS